MNNLELAKDPNTPEEALSELAKDRDWIVRSYAASNPNTPIEALAELAKDGYREVRCCAERNCVDKRKFIITNKYVGTQGTNHFWYKHKGQKNPFYTAGCFIGSRNQLICNIVYEGGLQYNERMRILSILDAKFDEIFNENK